MTFDQALDAMWRDLPGWTFVVRCSGDCAAFMARIRSRDYLVDEWTAGDETRSTVIRGAAFESGWCGTPAEAILEARDYAVSGLDVNQNAVRVAKQATGEK